MPTEQIQLTAVKVLSILSAMVLVSFALWAEYFKAFVQRKKDEGGQLDRPMLLSSARIAGLTALLFQFTLFMAANPIRESYPRFLPLLFAVTVSIQFWLQNRVEAQVRDVKATAQERSALALRGISWLMIAGAVYCGVVCTFVFSAAIACKVFHWQGVAANWAIALGMVVGVLSAIALNFALGPILTRRLLPTEDCNDGKILKMVSECFFRAGIQIPRVFTVDLEKFKTASVWVAGFGRGRGIFRPAIFISKSLFQELTEGELQTVILHEVSHLHLKHLKRRWALSCTLLFGMTFVASFSIILLNLIFKEGTAWIAPAIAAVAFMSSYRILAFQNRYHELEADIWAIEKLGGSLSDMVHALRKLDRVNDPVPSSIASHPPTERRIRALEFYFERKAEKQKQNPEIDKKAA